MASQKTKVKKTTPVSRKSVKSSTSPSSARRPVAKSAARSAVKAPVKKAAAVKAAPKSLKKTALKPAAKVKAPIKKTAVKAAAPKKVVKAVVKAPVKTAAKAPAKVAAKPALKQAAPKQAAPKTVTPVAKSVNPAVQKMQAAALKAKAAKLAKAAPVKPVSAKAAAGRAVAGNSVTAKAAAVPAVIATPVPVQNPHHLARLPAKPAQPAVQMSKFSTTTTPVKSAGNSKIGYKVGEHVVYPTHGVGQITAIEEQMIAGLKLELFVVFFAKDRMTLRVPVGKIASVGMRKISDTAHVAKSLETLKGRPRIKRTMWSRRAQEYEAKINSGDLISVAEVVRDLFRADNQPEQSYSERQLFEAALDRMVRELAVVNKVSDDDAQLLIENTLKKAPRRTRGAREEGDNVVPFAKADNDDGVASDEAAA